MVSQNENGSSALEAGELCQKCGLCCDGLIFSHVRLAPQDLPPLARNGQYFIGPKNRQSSLKLGCRFFKTCCTIYEDRPKKCRTYYCKLQRKVLNGTCRLDEAIDIVEQARTLRERIQKKILKNPQDSKNQLSFRALMTQYFDRAGDLNEKNQLGVEDEARICETFELVKLIDRHFENTSYVEKYGALIQSFTYKRNKPL